MKKQRINLMLGIVVAVSIACQLISWGNDVPENVSQVGGSGGGKTSEQGFPLTEDAFNITDLGDDSLLYYTKMPQKDVMDFYRDVFGSMGFTERELLTIVSDGVFSMVFDGDPSGLAIVIQSVDLGDGSSSVAIRREDT